MMVSVDIKSIFIQNYCNYYSLNTAILQYCYRPVKTTNESKDITIGVAKLSMTKNTSVWETKTGAHLFFQAG